MSGNVVVLIIFVTIAGIFAYQNGLIAADIPIRDTPNARELVINHIQSPPKQGRGRYYAPDATGLDQYQFSYEGKNRTYYAYAPRHIQGRRLPMILLLHGSGRNGVSLIEQWRPLADSVGLILVGPDSVRDGWSTKDDPAEFLETILRYAVNQYPVDTSRVYLFGHSAGGNYGAYMTLQMSEIFAGVALHAGAFSSPRHYTAAMNPKRKIPVLLILGDRDSLYPVDAVRQTGDRFAAKGHDTEMRIIVGHDHWIYDIGPFIALESWKFLSQYTY